MHSTLQRLNAVTALATSVILCLLALVDFTSFPSYKSTATVNMHHLEVLPGRAVWHMDRRVQDYLETRFDIDADFSDLFHWNTKQVFVSLVAEYETAQHKINQATIWDKIIRSKQDAHVVLVDSMHKYALREVSKSFANVKDVNFVLKWNAMPKIGQLHYQDDYNSGAIKVPVKRLGEDGEPLEPKKLWY